MALRCCFRAITASADEYSDKYLLGDWFGYRSPLAERGIKPTVLFIVDPFGNVTGGLRRGGANYDLLCLDLVVETGDLLALPGGQFHVGFAANFGASLSRHYVGNAFPIQLADVASAHPRLTYLWSSIFRGGSPRVHCKMGPVDVDVLLTPFESPLTGSRVIAATSARNMVAAIRQQLGAGGRIGRLRIVDSFGVAGAAHPLAQTDDLFGLKGLFAPGGQVEIFAGAAPARARAGGWAWEAGFSGVGLGPGTSRASAQERGINLATLINTLGVPVTFT